MMDVVRETRSTCPYCGVGCGVVIESQGSQITGIRGDPLHPANFGRLCTKGQSLHLTATAEVTSQTRLLTPQWRPVRGQAPQTLSWDAAIDRAAQGLANIVREHGADALGVYISGQLLTEDYYVFNKLVKGLLGTNHIDSNSRLCMSSAVAGYKLTLGSDAPPACYADIDLSGCLFIAGSNTAWAHPVLFRRIEDARERNPDLKMVVVDPRRTDTAAMADLHLQIQPGTDVLLFHGMLQVMLRHHWIQPAYIAAHTCGFSDLQALVADHTPEQVAEMCGVALEDLVTAARWFATSPATLSLYCQGLNQSSNGTAKNAALINLHLATAQIGKPGAGPLSLTGQPNAMGGREVGGMANLLSAHRDVSNPQHRREVAALWGVADVPARPGLTAVEMFQAAADGQIKALWIACTNPAQSLPDQKTVRRALERADLVILQEAFATTATGAFADLLLPAATGVRKRAPSPTASGASVASRQRCHRRVRPEPTGASLATLASSWHVHWAGRRMRACWTTRHRRPSGKSTARAPVGGISTSPAWAMRSWRNRLRNGRARKALCTARYVCIPMPGLRRRMAGRNLRLSAGRLQPRRAARHFRSRSTPVGSATSGMGCPEPVWLGGFFLTALSLVCNCTPQTCSGWACLMAIWCGYAAHEVAWCCLHKAVIRSHPCRPSSPCIGDPRPCSGVMRRGGQVWVSTCSPHPSFVPAPSSQSSSTQPCRSHRLHAPRGRIRGHGLVARRFDLARASVASGRAGGR